MADAVAVILSFVGMKWPCRKDGGTVSDPAESRARQSHLARVVGRISLKLTSIVSPGRPSGVHETTNGRFSGMTGARAVGPNAGLRSAMSAGVDSVPANAGACPGTPGAHTKSASPGVQDAGTPGYEGNDPASSAYGNVATSDPQGAARTVMVPALPPGSGRPIPEMQSHEVAPPAAVGAKECGKDAKSNCCAPSVHAETLPATSVAPVIGGGAVAAGHVEVPGPPSAARPSVAIASVAIASGAIASGAAATSRKSPPQATSIDAATTIDAATVVRAEDPARCLSPMSGKLDARPSSRELRVVVPMPRDERDAARVVSAIRNMTQPSIPKWQFVTGWVLSGVIGLLFLPSAFFKIVQPAGFLDGWVKSYPAGAARPLGLVELLMFVLYIVPKTRYLGGLVMLAYLGGAVATHLHMSDPLLVAPILVGIIGWLGLFLRDPKLRALVPTVTE